jgi:hypothetical protein
MDGGGGDGVKGGIGGAGVLIRTQFGGSQIGGENGGAKQHVGDVIGVAVHTNPAVGPVKQVQQ